jgi:hypothetical protein
MNRMKYLTILLFFCLINSAAFSQQIDNVFFAVTVNTIKLEYRVSGLKYNQTLNTELFVSTDGGKSFKGPLAFVSGNIGPGISNGQQIIVWEAVNEMKIENADLAFDVRGALVEEKIKRSVFVAFSGNMLTPVGVRAGLLGKTGVYVSIQSNFRPTLTGSYTYDDNTIIDYDRFAWYEFTSGYEVSAFAVCAGFTSQLRPNLFIYTGAGFGKEEYFYKINEYSYEDNSLLGSDFGKDEEASVKGLALEAGLIIRVKNFLIIGGGTSTGFQIPNWLAGIGYSF